MLLAAQQPLPSRALKAEPSRRRRLRSGGGVWDYTAPGVTEPGTEEGAAPREGPLTSPCSLRAVPTAPIQALGFFPDTGPGRLRSGPGPRRPAARAGERQRVSHRRWGTAPLGGPGRSVCGSASE